MEPLLPVYLVACDFHGNGGSRDTLHAALDGQESQRILENVHLVEALTDADTLREQLAAMIGPDDRIWVSRVTEDHSGYVMAAAAEWLGQRKPL